MAIYYFGYGSNMSQNIMREWCRDYKLIGAGYVEGWRLALTRHSERWGAGVADIVVAQGHRIWGGLYMISVSDLEALDVKESNGRHYQRTECLVNVGDQQFNSITYSVINKAPEPVATSTTYRDTMIAGARELGLPAAYIRQLIDLPTTVNR